MTAAAAPLTESLALYVRLENQQGIARATYALARMAMFNNDLANAELLYEQCLPIYTALNDADGLNSTYFNLAVIMRATGDLKRARDLFEICVYGERDQSSSMLMIGLANLSWLAISERDWKRAIELAAETLSLFETAGEIRHAIESAEAIAFVAGMHGHRERAAHLFSAVTACRRRLAYPVHKHDREEYDDLIAESRIQIDDAAVAMAAAQDIPFDAVVADALNLAAVLLTTVTSVNQRGLSPRELDVLRLLVEGKSDRDIAAELYISHHTVMRHVSNILGKLHVDSRTAAATYAVRERLV
jgi:DNA-binding CsgD family transcriptional regulator